MALSPAHADGPPRPRRLAALVLTIFLLTFLVARILVFFIMDGRLPAGLFFHARGTHVHHLNYGIFLLSGVGAFLLFNPNPARGRRCAAVAYAIGLALTFDEFGMWLHLGGGYWQRASFDAVVVIAAALALFAVAPSFKRFERRHWAWATVLVVTAAAFAFLFRHAFRDVARQAGPWLRQLEEQGPR